MSWTPSELAPERSALATFGAELRHWRWERRGLSLRALAEADGVYAGYSFLSKVETGRSYPSRELAEECDRALDTGDALARQWPRVDAERREAHQRARAGPEPSNLDETVTVEVRTPDGRTVRVNLSRRQFGELLAAGGLAAVIPGAVAPAETERYALAAASPQRVDTGVVDYLRDMLVAHKQADGRYGPSGREAVAAHLEALRRMLPDAEGSVRAALLSVGAGYAEFLAWLCWESGVRPAAASWLDRAVEWAQEAGDHSTTAYALVHKSAMAWFDGEASRAVGLARTAGGLPGLPPALRLLAAVKEAKGHALADEADRCRRALDEAEQLQAVRDPRDDPHCLWGYAHDQTYLEGETATCYREIGHSTEALTLFTNQLAELPDARRRNRGYLTAQLATTYALAGEPEQAATEGLETLAFVRETGTAYLRPGLDRLDRELTAWPSVPRVAEFREALYTYTDHASA